MDKQPVLQLHDFAVYFANGRPARPVVYDINLAIGRGDIVSLMGESGCGKTSLLRGIMGFLPSRGAIIYNGQNIANTRPEHRHFGVVFQHFLLFPHLNVAQNITFGLAKWDKHSQQERLIECLELIGMAGYDQAMPDQLSGGQQQRVALARALAPRPSMLLLDEPFAHLDIILRERIMLELTQIIRQSQTSALIVTHDRREAMAVSDKIAFLQPTPSGAILAQYGPPQQLYRQPQTLAIAQFMGDLSAIPIIKTASQNYQTPFGPFTPPPPWQNQTLSQLYLRPQMISIDPSSPIGAEITQKIFRGDSILYQAKMTQNAINIMVLAGYDSDYAIGDVIGLAWPKKEFAFMM